MAKQSTKSGSDKADRKKTPCPVTREEFRNGAKPVTIDIGGNVVTGEVKEFSTGSLGWYFNGKVKLKIGDKEVPVQVGINLTLVNSKELPD